MKVVFFLEDFPVTSQTFIYNQIIDLINKDHEVKIFALRHTKSTREHQNFLDYKLLEITTFYEADTVPKWKLRLLFLNFLLRNRESINFKKLFKKFKFFGYQRKTFNLEFFHRNLWILNHQNVDIIHAHFGPAGMYIAELLGGGFFARSKFVTTFHGYDLNPSNLETLQYKYSKLFREVDLMTVNTIYTKELLQQISNREEIEILPVGLFTDKFRKNNYKKKTDITLLFVGRLIELKGPDLAIKIVEILLNRGIKDIRLEIIGEGELKEDLLNYIRKNDLEAHVDCLGAMSQERIIHLMDQADVFLLPGIYDIEGRAETQGLVIQEAQAMELPVLISDVGGMKYGVIDGETGFVVKERDLETFADKIELLLKNKSLRRQMGEIGRSFVKEKYDSKVLGEKLETLYRQIQE